jgi:autophagy-related protein 2
VPGAAASDGQILPTPSNLAESFLEAEPQEEKEELQAAISSQSHILQKSSSFNEEEDEELGLGNDTLSLPSFVAAFLKGVADRLQLKIRDVAVRLDMELKQDGPSKRQPEDKQDLVAGLLSIREIDVHGVSDFNSDPGDSIPFREGKRVVSIEGINFGLVSDPVVFANYSRFTAPSSPTTTMQSKESRPSSRAPSPHPLDSSGSNLGLAMTQSTIFQPSTLSDHETVDYGSVSDHGLEGSAISHGGRFSDADSEPESQHDRYLEGSQMFGDDPFQDNPGYLDSVIDTQFDDFDDEMSASMHSQRDPLLESHDSHSHQSFSLRSSGIVAEHEDTDYAGRDSMPLESIDGSQTHGSQRESHVDLKADDPQHVIQSFNDSEDPFVPQMGVSQHLSQAFAAPSESGGTASGSATPDAELMESQYFSHDEAQSLYMSAISQGNHESFIPNMPGAWDSFAPSTTSTSTSEDHAERSSIAGELQVGQEGLDEASASTPKLTGQTGSDFGDQPLEGSQADTQSTSPDNASTPSSPTMHKMSEMWKPMLIIDKVLVWVPSTPDESINSEHPSPKLEKAESDLKDSECGLNESMVDESMFASKAYASTRFPRGPSEVHIHAETDRSGSSQKSPSSTTQELEVEIFTVAVHFDIAIGWLLIKACQRVMQVVPEEKQPKKQTSSNQPARQTSLHLLVHQLSVKFIEHVAGHSHSAETAGTPLPPPYHCMEDVVLQIAASGFKARFLADEKQTNLNLDISKFKFGLASDDLVSFNEALKMRESTRDVRTSSPVDISLSLSKSAKSAKLDISTLPLHLNLNIQQLEEVLGWMGGLSTILELGSSISSATTLKGGFKPPKKRPRGVHFETPSPASDKRSATSTAWKTNARCGGIVLDVVGETHYLKLSTTAVKLVSRFEGIGVQIDKAELAGPLPLDDSCIAPAMVSLDNIRVELLSVPKENDIDRLLALITPSKDKYDDDDDIMLDTLIRQRRQGSVLRTKVEEMEVLISNPCGLVPLSSLAVEMSRLSNVTKYLPEDDRPGILTLTKICKFDVKVQVGGEVGNMNANLVDLEAAWISLPSLIATKIESINILRKTKNRNEELVGEAIHPKAQKTQQPMFMVRFIPDEMDPTFKIKLNRLRVEYTIASTMAFLGLGQNTTGGEVAGEMANSIANLVEHSSRATDPLAFAAPSSDTSGASTKPIRLAVVLRDCVLGLNPRNSPSKGLVVLTNAKFSGMLNGEESSEATLDIRKSSIMIIDDVANEGYTDNLHQRSSAVVQSSQVQEYIGKGYVPVSTISSATAVVKMMKLAEDDTKSLDVELHPDLLILETCADSTQTLISILNGLQPPTPPSVAVKYRTEVMPLQDMLASFSGDAFPADPSLPPEFETDLEPVMEEHYSGEQLSDELGYVSKFDSGIQGVEPLRSSESDDLLDSFHSQYQVSSSLTELDFQEDHFGKQSAVGGTAHRWDSTHNTYGLSNDAKLQRSPLRVRIRDMHIIWNLFDGYDWQRTRDTISKAVKDVETKATERRARASRMSPTAEDEEESVIGDFLFNSIYIGIPANKDPRELHREINRDIDDLTSETGSHATTTTATGTTSGQGRPTSSREKKLRLHRSKHHKMTFELRGVCADLVVFPPNSEETQSSVDVRVKDLEIYDHVPTSTWKKFATYMHEAGERESGTSMVHIELLNVKPVPELAASEIVLKATVLPLRLHVDQDALDFMSRFFEFRDESAEEAITPGEVPFLQRVEVNAVQVRLDFKPKRVDYAGLRSGRTTEFMNFFVLDGADMVLRHVIIYGVSGFDRLGNSLNDIWMPDVKRNQLPGVLAGLAPIRSLVNVGGGVRDLVLIPMREYKKDGRIVRSIQKGAMAFGKTTSNEFVKLGAKLAIGTQTVLQGMEDMLASPNAPAASDQTRDEEEEEAKKISLYADQPVGVVAGIRGAYSSLERDLLLARDAIVAVPGEVVESGSAKAAAKAVWKRAPTVVLRPAIGVSKAVGQTLLGAGNTLDPSNRRKMEDKYKRH